LNLPAWFAALAAATAAAKLIATVAASSTTTPTAKPSPAASSFRFGSGFVDVQSPSSELGSIQSLDGLCSGVIACHLDKPKPTGAARIAIRHNLDSRNFAKLLKQRLQFALRSLETQVSHEQILHSIFSLTVAAFSIAAAGSQSAKPTDHAQLRGI
jgi:hypothetical protein